MDAQTKPDMNAPLLVFTEQEESHFKTLAEGMYASVGALIVAGELAGWPHSKVKDGIHAALIAGQKTAIDMDRSGALRMTSEELASLDQSHTA